MEKTNSTSKLSIILLVISAFCFFTTALLGYQNYQLQSQISSLESKINSKPTIILTPTPTLSITPTIRIGRILCGGIAGLACPDGTICKLDGTYPDASGTCEQSKMGILVGKVLKSPTCAGPQQVGQVCESPYINGNFKIMREEGSGNVHLVEIKKVKTDSLGKFITELEPGNYKLQSLSSGIGKEVTNNDFSIISEKITRLNFNVDTGIR